MLIVEQLWLQYYDLLLFVYFSEVCCEKLCGVPCYILCKIVMEYFQASVVPCISLFGWPVILWFHQTTEHPPQPHATKRHYSSILVYVRKLGYMLNVGTPKPFLRITESNGLQEENQKKKGLEQDGLLPSWSPLAWFSFRSSVDGERRRLASPTLKC